MRLQLASQLTPVSKNDTRQSKTVDVTGMATVHEQYVDNGAPRVSAALGQ